MKQATSTVWVLVLGNDVAIKAYREGKLPFPDGTIIAALHYRNVPSDENNKVFGRVQSFVPGSPTNIQFMVKDSTKYAATGGWGFAHFQDGKPGDAAFMKSCFPCHEKAKATDLCLYSLRTLTLNTSADRSGDGHAQIKSSRVPVNDCRNIAISASLRFPFAYLANKRRKVV